MTNGTITATDFTATSDARLKTVVGKIDNALAQLQTLNGVRYQWNQLAKDLNPVYQNDDTQIGMLAQEVQKIAPEAVKEVDGYLTVSYDRIIPLIVEAIKELKALIDAK
jgi:hypothetical protein